VWLDRDLMHAPEIPSNRFNGDRMRRSLPIALTCSLTLLAVQRLEAQDLSGAYLGRRVRVWAPDPTVGTLIRADSAVFVLVTDARDTVTRSRRVVRRADISHGRHSATLNGAAIGAGLGGVVGGIVGATSYHKPECDPQRDLFCPNFRPAVIVLGAAVGVVSGAVIGAAIGSRTQVDRWQQAPGLADVRLTAAPSREGLRLGVSASF
jgi:hypothetical protein